MSMFRFLSVPVLSLLFISQAKAADIEYIWIGSDFQWNSLNNWRIGSTPPSAAPGATSSAYTHWLVTSGTDSTGQANVGSLGAGGRYLKGIKIAGINNQSVEKIPFFILNTTNLVYLRVHDGGISVTNPDSEGYNTDFGVAQLRISADQTWHAAEGRTFYVGKDDQAPSGGSYSLTSENDAPRKVTLTGPGTVRIGKSVLLNNITNQIGFAMNAGKGTPTLDLTDHGMSNAITVEDAARLAGMSLYQGNLITREKTVVTLADTTAKASDKWSIGAETAFILEDSTLDLSSAAITADVTHKGTSGITGNQGTLKQTILDNAQVTYTNREVKANELASIGKNVTITLNNASIHFDDPIPKVDLIVQGDCALEGNGLFTGTITYAPGSSLAMDGITMSKQTITLGSNHIATLDGVPQQDSEQPNLSAQQGTEYTIVFDASVEKMIAAWPGEHTLTVRFKPDMTADVTVKTLPKGGVSWHYDASGKILTLKTNVAATPPMPPGISGSKPNIIFVLVDDMGWGDLEEFWNNQDKNGRIVTRRNSFKTPELNSMAREGMQMRRHYSAAPVCAPARASLILGVHQGHSRVVRNNTFDHPIENSHTLGTVLQGAGYRTAAIGKWGIGGSGQSGFAMTAAPHQRGFDYFYGIMDHLSGHYHYITESRDLYEYNDRAASPTFSNVKGKVPDTAYDTDLFGARAKQWIIDHHTRSASQPFFMYLAFPAPHGSLAVPACAYPANRGLKGGLQWVDDNGDGYEACNTATTQRATAAGVEGTFAKDSYIHPDNQSINDTTTQQTEKRHATMIRRVDDVMGDLIQTLKDLGIDNNTMIVFTSDNGPHNEAGSDPNHNRGAQNPSFFQSYGMMDGIKRDCWEGGMREPTLVRWPGVIATNGINLHASQFQDWMATFADAAGVPVPARCDGVSLLPTLAGVPERQQESNIYVEYTHDSSSQTPNYPDFLTQHKNIRGLQQVVFVNGFKGIRRHIKTTDQDFQIYDTEKDPQESTDLASSRPDLQAKMKARILSGRRASPTQNTGLNDGYAPSVTPPSNRRQGLKMRCWNRRFDWVPDFRQLQEAPSSTGAVSTLDVNAGTAARKGVELTGYLTVPTTGEYKFYLQTDSNTGSRAFVHLHDMQLIDADYVYTPGSEANSNAREGAAVSPNATQTVKLEAGIHPIRIGYAGQTASSSISMQWEGPGIGRQAIPASAFSYEYVNAFNIDKTQETSGFSATTTTLTVQTQLPWNVSCDQAWVLATPSAGAGTTTLNIAVTANSSQTDRTAVMTVSCNGEEKTFTLLQKGSPAPTGYEKWKKKHFPDGTPSDKTDPGACPAGDGITNLMKYATNKDPNKPCGSVTTLTARKESGTLHLALAWQVNPEATDVTFSVESSGDLTTWVDEGHVTPAGATGEYLDPVAIDDAAPRRRFLRLKVTRGEEKP